MKRWWRRIRAALGMGFMWAAAWAVAAGLLARLPGVNTDLPLGFLLAPLGFLSGIIFSAILAGVAARRRFEHMSLGRFAGWGALSGLMLSGSIVGVAAVIGDSLAGQAMLLVPALAGASAACAAGSLAVARRADRQSLTGPPAI